jgi:hypothetical protein
MTQPWNYQIRVYLGCDWAALARSDPGHTAIQPLMDVLAAHHATLRCQFDAFADYVAEAERNDPADYPLYKWTKVTIEDPDKKQKHLKAFAVRVDDREVYPQDVADALEASLQPLVDGTIITRLSKHDTNPANNLPVPEHLRT